MVFHVERGGFGDGGWRCGSFWAIWRWGAENPVLATWVKRCGALIGLLGAVETHLKYSGYLRQEERQVARLQASEARSIPVELDYGRIPGLSREMVDKFRRVRPVTLGEASRIPGVTPAAVSVLDIYPA